MSSLKSIKFHQIISLWVPQILSPKCPTFNANKSTIGYDYVVCVASVL